MFGIKTEIEARQMVATVEESMKEAVAKGKFGDMYDLSLKRAHYMGVWGVLAEFDDAIEVLTEKVAEGKMTEVEKLYRLQSVLTRTAARGADDQWSGSGNEQQRAIFRGKCEIIQELSWSLREQMETLVKN